MQTIPLIARQEGVLLRCHLGNQVKTGLLHPVGENLSQDLEIKGHMAVEIRVGLVYLLTDSFQGGGKIGHQRNPVVQKVSAGFTSGRHLRSEIRFFDFNSFAEGVASEATHLNVLPQLSGYLFHQFGHGEGAVFDERLL